jgi:hypothetical protein
MLGEIKSQFPPTSTAQSSGWCSKGKSSSVISLGRANVRLLFASLLGCGALWHACGQPAADLLADGFRLKGTVISMYPSTGAGPATVLRFKQAYRDYESRGFFRIGILPIAVVEGVTFELQSCESVTNSLEQLQQWLRSKAAGRLELRRVTFLVSGPLTNRLESGRADLVADGRLALLNGVNFMSGTNQVQATHGTLQFTGAQAGLFVLETSPPWTNSLFGRFDTPQPSNQATKQ